MKYYCVLRTRLHSRTGHPPTHQSRLPIFLPWASKDQTNPTTANYCNSSLTTTDENKSLSNLTLHWTTLESLQYLGCWWPLVTVVRGGGPGDPLELKQDLDTGNQFQLRRWRDRHFVYFETLWWNLLCMQISSQLPTSVVPWPNFLVKCS